MSSIYESFLWRVDQGLINVTMDW